MIVATSPVRSQPSSVNDSRRAVVVVVAGGDPRSARLQLAAGLAVPRPLLAGVLIDDPDLHQRRGDALGGAQARELLLVAVGERRAHAGDRPERARLGHPPGLQDRHAELLAVGLRERARDRRAAADDPRQRRELAAVELVEHAEPDRRDAGGERDALGLHQVGDRARGEVRAGHDEVGAGHHAGLPEPPGVGVEHRHHREDHVALADAERVGEHRADRVQDGRAVRVDDALRVARRAARVTHGRGAPLVPVGERRGLGGADQLLVVDDPVVVGHLARAVVDDHDVAHRVEARRGAARSSFISDRSAKMTSSSAWSTM